MIRLETKSFKVFAFWKLLHNETMLAFECCGFKVALLLLPKKERKKERYTVMSLENYFINLSCAALLAATTGFLLLLFFL